MSDGEDEDKPTVILDLNALKKQKQKQEEDLVSMVTDLEFNLPEESESPEIEQGLVSDTEILFPVILFDYESDFFDKSFDSFPDGFDYRIVRTLAELNPLLRSKEFQILVFHYDGNPKVVNQLSAQIKVKFPHTKTLIMARSISPEKAKIHAASKSGAHGYYQYPVDAEKVKAEFLRIHSKSD